MHGTIVCNLITAFDMGLITAFPFTSKTKITYSMELLCLTVDIHTVTQLRNFRKNNCNYYTWCFQGWSVGLELRKCPITKPYFDA
jgi:hypothetical protein